MKSVAYQAAFAPRAAARGIVATGPNSRTALHDPRWPAVATALQALRDRKRYAVRIMDADCGAGCLLLHAVRHARALGFTAIEGHGTDGSPALIGRARAAAARLGDPAIGVTFELCDMVAGLREEHDLPADIVLWHDAADGDPRGEVAAALRLAGERVIGDAAAMPQRHAA